MAYVSIDQKNSHCLDNSWQIPPSLLVTVHFSISRCSPPNHRINAAPLPQVSGYAIVTEGTFLLKRFRVFGIHDFDVALNETFMLPRDLVHHALAVPLEILLIDEEEGVSSR
jgi:hypothetical protein